MALMSSREDEAKARPKQSYGHVAALAARALRPSLPRPLASAIARPSGHPDGISDRTSGRPLVPLFFSL